MDPLFNVKSVTQHLIQKENLRSMLYMRSIEGKAFVGNDDAENRNATQDISSSYSDSHIVVEFGFLHFLFYLESIGRCSTNMDAP